MQHKVSKHREPCKYFLAADASENDFRKLLIVKVPELRHSLKRVFDELKTFLKRIFTFFKQDFREVTNKLKMNSNLTLQKKL